MNWPGLSLERMHTEINGGAGFDTAARSAQTWRAVAGSYEDVSNRMRAATARLGGEWSGQGATAMVEAHTQYDRWAQDARSLADAADRAAEAQVRMFTETTPKIEAPGSVGEADDIVSRSVLTGVITGVTKDERG